MGTDLPDGWLVEAEADELARLAVGRCVLELGSWKGRSTVVLARVASFVVSVDNHRPMPAVYGIEGDSFDDYFENVRDLENVASVVADFLPVTGLFRRDAFGLVFVDGVHDLENATADLDLARYFDCPVAAHDWGRYKTTEAAERLGMIPDHVVGTLAVFLRPIRRRTR